jgi:hypothetical protein
MTEAFEGHLAGVGSSSKSLVFEQPSAASEGMQVRNFSI